MLLTNVLTPSQPSRNQTPPPESQPTEPAQEEQTQSETTSTGSGSAAQPSASSESTTTVAAMQEGELAKPVVQEAKLSDAENEAFARAAAQRNVDSIRTRALIDGISPVNNNALQAAKSYLTPVEPKEAMAEADSQTPARTEAASLDKAA